MNSIFMVKKIKRLYRASSKNSVVAGVCAGIADYFSADPVFVRLLWALFVLASSFGILAYMIAWVIIPRK